MAKARFSDDSPHALVCDCQRQDGERAGPREASDAGGFDDGEEPSSEPIAETLGRQIRLHRCLRGWGPSELARRARISRTALFRIERGSTSLPRAVTLQRIAQAFQIPVDALLNEADPESSAVPDAGTCRASPAPILALEGSAGLAGAEVRAVEDQFLDLVHSPLGGWVVRLVQETHRWLSTVDPGLLATAPPPGPATRSAEEVDPAREDSERAGRDD